MVSWNEIISNVKKHGHDITFLLIIGFLCSVYFYKVMLSSHILVHEDYRYALAINEHLHYHFNHLNIHGPKLPVLGVLYILGLIFGDIMGEKIFVPVILFISAFFFYLSNKYFISRILKISDFWLSFSSLIGVLVFLYNPWTINIILLHYWAVFSLASLYILLVYFDKVIRSSRFSFKYAFILSLLVLLTATQPQSPIIYAGPLIMLYVIVFTTFEKKEFLKKLFSKRVIITLFILILFNSFWILPSLTNIFYGMGSPSMIKGGYGIVIENVDILSQRATILNSLKATNRYAWGGFGWFSTPNFNLSVLGIPIWNFSSLLPALFTLVSIFLATKNIKDKKKKKYVLYFSLLFVISVLLSTGSYYPYFGVLYKLFFLNVPLGWMVRDPYKNTGIMIICISFFISLLVAYIGNIRVKRMENRWVKYSIITLIISFILIWGWPGLTGDLNGYLKPYIVEYPKDLECCVSYLQDQHNINKYNIVVYPVDDEFYTYWDVPTLIMCNLNTRDIGETESKVIRKYLDSGYKEGIENILSKLGTKYIILRHDISLLWESGSKRQELEEEINEFEVLFKSNKVKEFGNFSIYALNDSKEIVSIEPNIVYDTSPSLIKISKFDNYMELPYINDFVFISSNCTVPSLLDSTYIYPKSNHYDPAHYWSYGTLFGGWLNGVDLSTRFNNSQTFYGKGLVFVWASKKIPKNIMPTKRDLIVNYAFEKDLNVWKTSAGFKTCLSNNSYSGISSLKVTTNIPENSSWSWIRGPEINVTSGEAYLVITHMKYENVVASHIPIEGYFKSSGEWKQLVQIPGGKTGTSDWKEYKGIIEIPSDVTKIRIVLNAGWVKNSNKGNATTWFDNIAVYNITKYCNPVQISTTFNIERQDTYKLFIRYFKNQEGGEIKVYLDRKPITINTKDQLNKFVWKDLEIYPLENGEHTLVLENVKGFNAVNLFALIPEKEYEKSKQEISRILQNKIIIYLFEAESDMYRDNANITKKFGGEASNGEALEITNGKAWQEVEIINNGTYKLAIRAKGDFKVQIGAKKFEYHTTNLTHWYSPIFKLNEGKYNLTITPLNTPAANFSFESVSPNINIENVIIGEFPQGIISFSNDSYSGKSSLKITTNVSEGWLWFRTTEVNVTPKERYLAITHMKYENVVASYISIEGYNETSGEWSELGEIPSGQTGTSDWKEYKQILAIPENITKIGFVLNAGWIKDLSEGNATTWFDDIRIYPVKDYLDVMWLYSTRNNETLNELFKTNETPAVVINYTKINPTKYEVEVKASKPFMLSFAEAYDPLWEARVCKDGEKVEVVKSIPLYSVINGFWIDETGDLEIEIRYKPQDWFELGLGISVTTFIGCIGYLFYDWRRGKGDKWVLRIGARLHNACSVVSRGLREGVWGLKKKLRRRK